jgi:hypothetical protein
LVGQEFGAIEIFHLSPGRAQRLARKGQRVGAHIGDVTVLIQALRDPHGAAGVEAQFAARLLLQGRGHERWVGTVGERFFGNVGDLERCVRELGGERFCRSAVEHQRLRLELAGLLVEVFADRDLASVELGQAGGETAFALLAL